jgi:hypothetical protein
MSHIHDLLAQMTAEGFQASLDEDGDLRLKYEGMSYALCFDQDDPLFSKLVLPNVWALDSEQEFGRALAAVDEINRRLKLVKAHTVGDQVWLGVELWLPDPSGWRQLLPRALRSLSHGVHLLTEQMRAAPASPQKFIDGNVSTSKNNVTSPA